MLLAIKPKRFKATYEFTLNYVKYLKFKKKTVYFN